MAAAYKRMRADGTLTGPRRGFEPEPDAPAQPMQKHLLTKAEEEERKKKLAKYASKGGRGTTILAGAGDNETLG